MKLVQLILCVVIVVASFLADASCNTNNEPDGLILVHTLFRHGNRTIEDNIYDANPYGNSTFWPQGYGQLTKEGKLTEYKIGEALRERYNDFIGSEYEINLIDARSTNVNRTKMSLLLVLASLFPPTVDSSWNNELKWQPIPYNTFDVDFELGGRRICKNYDKKYKDTLKKDEVVKLLEPYEKMFDYLTENAEKQLENPKKVADFYLELRAQLAYGYPIEEWTYKYWDQMYNLTTLNYRLMAYKKKLRKLSTGYFLQKVIKDTENRITNPNSPTKLYLYSAHETNIALLLVTLDVYDYYLPAFGSYVTIEVHKIDGAYGFKMYYQNYQKLEPVLLKLPNCGEEFCPLDKFKQIVSEYIPDEDDCELN